MGKYMDLVRQFDEERAARKAGKIEMTPKGCPNCGGGDYWVSIKRKRFCVNCNDGRVFYEDVIALGRLSE